jgi:hypothetical protein
MALGSAQPLIEMITRNLSGGKGRPARKADNLTANSESIVWKMWEPRRLTSLWAPTACYRNSFTFFIAIIVYVQRNVSHRIKVQWLACELPALTVRRT